MADFQIPPIYSERDRITRSERDRITRSERDRITLGIAGHEP